MSGPLAVIDSSVFIGAKDPDEPEYKDCLRVLQLVDQQRVRGLVSTITIAEVAAGYYLEGDTEGRQEFLSYLRASHRITVVPVDLEVAEVAARVRSEVSLRLPDALIVATALHRGAECVVTHDREFTKAAHIVPTSTAKTLAQRV
jgi:predicted nucleic acid-binding protein